MGVDICMIQMDNVISIFFFEHKTKHLVTEFKTSCQPPRPCEDRGQSLQEFLMGEYCS